MTGWMTVKKTYEGTRIQTIKLRLVMTRESSTAHRACCHKLGDVATVISGPVATAIPDAVMRRRPIYSLRPTCYGGML